MLAVAFPWFACVIWTIYGITFLLGAIAYWSIPATVRPEAHRVLSFLVVYIVLGALIWAIIHL